METNHHFHHLFLLLILLLLLITTTTTQTLPPSPSPSPSPPPSPPSLQPQLNNIIDALIGAGDFSIWVNILSTSNPTLLPVSATLFIPQDTTTTTLNNNNGIPMVDPFLFPYHVVPQRLTFSDLLLFRRNSRLPTLLPGKSISVTDNSAGNISLDGTLITHPDLYSTANVAVHGVAAVLDYSLFGEGVPPPPPPPPLTPENAMPPPFMPIGETVGAAWRSGAPAAGNDSLWCTSVQMAFLVLVLLLQELVFLVQMINV